MESVLLLKGTPNFLQFSEVFGLIIVWKHSINNPYWISCFITLMNSFQYTSLFTLKKIHSLIYLTLVNPIHPQWSFQGFTDAMEASAEFHCALCKNNNKLWVQTKIAKPTDYEQDCGRQSNKYDKKIPRNQNLNNGADQGETRNRCEWLVGHVVQAQIWHNHDRSL